MLVALGASHRHTKANRPSTAAATNLLEKGKFMSTQRLATLSSFEKDIEEGVGSKSCALPSLFLGQTPPLVKGRLANALSTIEISMDGGNPCHFTANNVTHSSLIL